MKRKLDKIVVERMLFVGKHGVSLGEKALAQPFEVDVELEADLTVPRATDNLAQTIDYREIHAVAKAVIEGDSRNLLERLADDIAVELLAKLPTQSVRVKVRKPHYPLGGNPSHGVSVEVYGEKD